MIDHSKDQLAEDAAAALALGMSYGKYKALQRENILPSNPKPIVKVEIGPPCLICGQPVPKGKRKYCGPACADMAHQLQLSERQKQRRKK